MNEVHDILLSKKKLWNWANAVVNHENWQEFLAYAKAHVMNTRTINPEGQAGIQSLCDAMKELTEPKLTEATEVKMGLNHDLDIDRTQPLPKRTENPPDKEK